MATNAFAMIYKKKSTEEETEKAPNETRFRSLAAPEGISLEQEDAFEKKKKKTKKLQHLVSCAFAGQALSSGSVSKPRLIHLQKICRAHASPALYRCRGIQM